MEFLVKSGQAETQKTACIVVGVFESKRLSSTAESLNKASSDYIKDIISKGDLDGKLGYCLFLYNVPNISAERILLVGCGKERELNFKNFSKIVSCVAKKLDQSAVTEATFFLQDIKIKNFDIRWHIRQAVLLFNESLYNFDIYKSKKEAKQKPLRKLNFCLSSKKDLSNAQLGLAEGNAISSGVNYTKNLGNMPANFCTPAYLAKEANKLSKKYHEVNSAILDRKDMESLGMGSLLAVAQGSVQPPKLITLEYSGTKDNSPPIIFVGKGITFDTGGNSLKPPKAMIGMKYDMCGAATVFGLIKFAAELQLPLKIIGVIASAENMPGATACRPNDIVTSMSGRSIEILNTDAEGRLVLCDALTYCERFDPAAVIDIATLTGACVVALGKHNSALYSNNDKLAHEISKASDISKDKCWRMPLGEEYHQQLDSVIADVANIGGPDAGSITAACFLEKFATKYNWAHLDVAGTASNKENAATGRPVPLLAQYLLNKIKA